MRVDLSVSLLLLLVVGGLVALAGGVFGLLRESAVRREVLREVRSRGPVAEVAEPVGYRDARTCPTCGRAVERVEIPGATPVASSCSVPAVEVDAPRFLAIGKRLDLAARLRAVDREDLVPLMHRLPDDLLGELEEDVAGFERVRERSRFERLLTRNETPVAEPGRGKSRLG